MTIDPNYDTIGRLFEKGFTFQVPKYQRNYAWGDSEITDFLDDFEKLYYLHSNIEDKNNKFLSEHFFGGIVSVRKKVTGSTRQLYELIDGQQRIATFVLLMASLIYYCNHIAKEAEKEKDIENKEIALGRAEKYTKLFIKYDDEVNRKKIVVDRINLSFSDDEFFKNLISFKINDPLRDSHNRLTDAYKRIKEKIGKIINSSEDIGAKLDSIEKIYNLVMENCTIVHIISDSKDEAYRLFQVLNDRGKNLTEGDLLKARTLEILDSGEYLDILNNAFHCWERILQDRPENTKNFLKWYYSSCIGKSPSNNALFDDFLNKFFPEHVKQRIEIEDAEKILNTIENIEIEFNILRKLVEGDWPYIEDNKAQWHKDRLRMLISCLGHTHCIPLLLSASKLDSKNFSELVHILEKFFFRYKNICNGNINSLSKIYHQHSLEVRKDPKKYDIRTIIKELLVLENKHADDTIFKNQISKELIYNNNQANKLIKYFLITIEYYFDWYLSKFKGKPRFDKNIIYDFSNTTIEHIYPRNAKNKIEELEKIKNHIENLSFLGPLDNNDCGNEDYLSKKPIYEKSSVKMNREIAKNSKWCLEEVTKRRENLLQAATEVFSLKHV